MFLRQIKYSLQSEHWSNLLNFKNMKAKNFFSTANAAVAAMWIVIMMSVKYNRLTFLIWSLFAPKKAARSLHKKNLEYNSPRKEIATYFWDKINASRKMLPWKSRKALLLEGRLEHASFEEQVKIFHQSDIEYLIKEQMLSKEVLRHVFGDCGNLLPQVVKQLGELSSDEIGMLLAQGRGTIVLEYLKQQRSEEILRRVAYYAKRQQGDALIILCWYIKRNSLPKGIIADLMNSPIKEEVQKALESYAERQIILTGKKTSSLFESYCKKMEDKVYLQPENQVFLDDELYEIYHNHGGKLDDEAIEHFFSKEDVLMSNLIFAWEFKETGRKMTDKQKALVNSSAELTKNWVGL